MNYSQTQFEQVFNINFCATYDFYDKILFQYYGKKYVSEDEADEPYKGCIVEMYVWKDNFYISEVKYEQR